MIYFLIILTFMISAGLLTGFIVCLCDYAKEKKEIKQYIEQQKERVYENETK